MWHTNLILFLQAIRAINGHENQETSAEDFTNRVFDRIDINGDGKSVGTMWRLRFKREFIVGGQCLDTYQLYCCQERHKKWKEDVVLVAKNQ